MTDIDIVRLELQVALTVYERREVIPGSIVSAVEIPRIEQNSPIV
jgi:hypothetical protein